MVQYLDNNSGFNNWNAMRQSQNKSKKSIGFWGWLLLFLIAWWAIGALFQSKQAQIEAAQPMAIETSVLESEKMDSDKISIDVRGLRLSNIALKDYKQSVKSPEAVALLNSENNFIEIGFMSSDTAVPNINTKWKKDSDNMVWNNNAKVVFNRNISVQNYVIKISDTVKNNSAKEISITPYARIISGMGESKTASVETGGVVYANSNLDYENWMKLNKKSYAYSTVRGSFGFAEQYWETIIAIDSNDQTISLKKNGDLYFADTIASPVKIATGESRTIDTFVFAGPSTLKSHWRAWSFHSRTTHAFCAHGRATT